MGLGAREWQAMRMKNVLSQTFACNRIGFKL